MSVSLCVLRIEIDEDLPEMGDNPAELEAIKEQKKRDRGARESRKITVETYASAVSGPNSVSGILPTSSRRLPSTSSVSDDTNTISFFCGNPLVEVTKGVLHLYKENELKDAESNTLCLLRVPSSLSASDLLAFAAACQQDIAHVRVLRDGSTEHYMALITFRSPSSARTFHSSLEGLAYSSLEPGAACHMVWVSRVEWGARGEAPPRHTELPTCAVCLERMDESVAGVLSLQCAHAFHADCLARCRDARCPVCRCAQVPDAASLPACAQCEDDRRAGEQATEEEPRLPMSDACEGMLETEGSSLWICLICGHVGCGRYEGGHAAKHYLASNHTYALQIGSNRVWDYAGDNFVHRLVANKPDGKLVAAGAGEDAAEHDKLEAAQLEFTYTLTHQLDSQRMYYEQRISRLESDHKSECDKLRSRASEAESEASKLKEQVATLTKENKVMEKKMQQLNAKLSVVQSSLSEERGLASALAASHKLWQQQADRREQEHTQQIAELKDQLRDLMFFVEARGQLQQSGASTEELQTASVSVAPKPRRKRR